MKCACVVFAVIYAFDIRQRYSAKAKDVFVKIANVLSFSVNAMRTMLHVDNNVNAKDAKIVKISTKSRKRKSSKQITIKHKRTKNKNHSKSTTEFCRYLSI
jgi:hypothetical protein